VKAQTLHPAEIFSHQVRYVVPLFQRPYVWNEQEQWAPLWDDIRAVADRVLDTPVGYASQPVAPHFLGAIVLDQSMVGTGFINTRHVIDGQQRLTTLQLILDAAQWVAEQHGQPMDSQALRVMVLNPREIVQQPDEVFKVWPTDRDQAAFRAAMDNDTQVPAELATSTIARAHEFFVRQIESWAEVTGDPDKAKARLHALTMTLREHLKLVVIDLEPGDNAQVIFETLNHRGAPLLAADLIKNLVFQIAIAQGRDVETLYRRHWTAFDSDEWRQRIARGRQYIPRIDLFVNHWLITTSLQEVPADRIFVAFRDQLLLQQPDIETLLRQLASDAQIFAKLESWPPDSVVGRFTYRVLQAMDSAVVTPLLLWLLRWPEAELPTAQRDKALTCLESWLVRRALCRLTSKDLNRLVLDLLRELDTAGPTHAGDLVEQYLLAQTVDSRFWPTDADVLESLRTMPIYKTLLRARLRMLLEAFEERTRTAKSEHPTCPRNLTVEHVMPQAWREHWGDDVYNEAAAARRDDLIHTIGNLTLVNTKLNPALSNRPWTDAAAEQRGLGSTGKRSELLRHSTLKLNADLMASAPDRWDHSAIEARTAGLAQLAVAIWPRPDTGPTRTVPLASAEQEPLPTVDEPVAPNGEAAIGKYQPLTDWLHAQTADTLPVGFEDIEDVLGVPLAPSARNYLTYWYSTHNALGKAIAAAGFKASRVNLTEERLELHRQ
jgi:hypothetical protein